MAASAGGRPAITKKHLADGQYVHSTSTKRQIVLHHTVGGSLESTLRWWNDDPRRIATAYLIDRRGRIVEAFPPAMWAWHLGIKDRDAERMSIGIELVSVGPVRMNENGWRGIAVDVQVPREQVQSFDWRGYHNWQAYADAQVRSAGRLCRWLCARFKITPRMPPVDDLLTTNLPKYLAWNGVVHHAMLRKDKSDLHPGFDWQLFEEELS